MRNCSGESITRHSSSDFWTEFGADGAAMKLFTRIAAVDRDAPSPSSGDGRATSQWDGE